MLLKFEGLLVRQCIFRGLPEGVRMPVDPPVQLGFEPQQVPDRLQSFQIAMGLKVLLSRDADEKPVLELDVLGKFEAIGDLEPDFFTGPWANINAPAITYPYVRAFVATFFVNAGYPALHLPAYNFMAFQKAESTEE